MPDEEPSKYDNLTKNQLVAELRRTARREEKLSDELTPLRKLQGLATLDKDGIDLLNSLFKVGAKPIEVASGLRVLAEQFDPVMTKETKEPKDEPMSDVPPATTEPAAAPPRANLSPEQIQRLQAALGRNAPAPAAAAPVAADPDAMVAKITESVVQVLDQREQQRAADARRDELASPFIQRGYDPQNESHHPALNEAVRLRAEGHPEEVVLNIVNQLYPLGDATPAPVEGVGNTAEEVAAAISPVPEVERPAPIVKANTLPPVPKVASADGVTEGDPSGVPARPDPESQVARGLYRSNEGKMVDDRGIAVPPINSPEFANYVDAGVGELLAQQSQVGA